jgi:hypothetical protein
VKALLLVAAALAMVLAGAHSYLGERYIITRLLRRTDLPKLFGNTEFTKRTLRFAWHLTSVAWVGFAGLLATLGLAGVGTQQAQARVISATFVLSGIVALVGSRGRHVSWVIFFAIAALTWIAYP